MSTDTQAPTEVMPSEVASRGSRPDWGDMNRELLARRLRTAFLQSSPFYDHRDVEPKEIEKQWLKVADEAIEVIQESP